MPNAQNLPPIISNVLEILTTLQFCVHCAYWRPTRPKSLSLEAVWPPFISLTQLIRRIFTILRLENHRIKFQPSWREF